MISSLQRASDAFVWRRALLVPICLCLVAGGHAWRVHAHGQTAWKGGGFGMFSTVDSEHARFVKAYLLTSQGEIPVAMPDNLRKRMAQLRAAPNLADAERLAHKLLEMKWVDQQHLWSQRADHLAQANSSHAMAIDLKTSEVPTSIWSYRPSGSVSPIAVRRDAGEQAIAVEKVRLEVWRYHFEADAAKLSATCLLSTTLPKQEG
jgi:hypothetical protein